MNNNSKEEKNINPLMRFDASMANVQDGGLRSVSAINMLVCYLVSNLNGKISIQTLLEATDESMVSNHFETSNAITKLLKSQTIKQNEDGMLYMDDKDIVDVELIELDLPLTVRQRSFEACQRIISKETYKRENRAIVEPYDTGYLVKLSVSDYDTDFLKLELYAPTKVQAEMIKDKFISNPVKVYEILIKSIFENET